MVDSQILPAIATSSSSNGNKLSRCGSEIERLYGSYYQNLLKSRGAIMTTLLPVHLLLVLVALLPIWVALTY